MLLIFILHDGNPLTKYKDGLTHSIIASNNGFCVLQQAGTCKFTTTEEQETYEAQTTSRDVIKLFLVGNIFGRFNVLSTINLGGYS